MNNKKKNHESIEDYLEAIYLLTKDNNEVHAIMLANSLGFSKASVSRATHKLVKLGLLIIDNDNHLKLTLSGLSQAQNIYERHHTLKEYLISLGIDETTADEDACRIEHVISDTTFNKIKEKLKK